MTIVSPLTITVVMYAVLLIKIAGDLDKRRSTSNYVFTLASGAIS